MERFLNLSICPIIGEKSKDKGIDIANRRDQSSDTASNISFKYNGMQANILEANPLAMRALTGAKQLSNL